jgi:chemotaxis protein methyltransferase CheR
LLTVDELNAGAHYLMALCQEHAGDRAAAEEHDRAAVYLDPFFAMPHLHLGLLAKRSNDTEAAQRELSHALTLLAREDASRILLFGGGFTREALTAFCRAELRAVGGAV